jgi:hypothetical protein
MASFFTINPIWNYGPYDPSPISAGTQPDWYIGFADGALRLAPTHWEFVWLNHTWSFNIIAPILVLVVFILLVWMYPFIEGWITGDKREHHILDRPRNAPTRTAIGAAGMIFYACLWAAAGSDIIAVHFNLTLEGVIRTLQVGLIVFPIIGYFITMSPGASSACRAVNTLRFTNSSMSTNVGVWSASRPISRSCSGRTVADGSPCPSASVRRSPGGSSKTGSFRPAEVNSSRATTTSSLQLLALATIPG